MNIAAFASLFNSYCEKYLYKETPESTARPLFFMHYDMEDLLNSLRDIQLPALFLSTPEDDFGGENADSIHESYEASFMVLLQLPDNDINQKAEIINTAKDICDNIIRRMMYDCRETTILDGLNIQGIKAGVVSRTADALYGWTVSFNIIQGFDGAIRPWVWGDLV